MTYLFFSRLIPPEIKSGNDNTPSLSCGGLITIKIDVICPFAIPNQISTTAHLQSQTRSPQYQCTYQFWWKSFDIYSSYRPETKIWKCGRQITLSKICEICPFSIQNQISILSRHILSLVKIYWYLLKLSSGNENTDAWRARKIDKIFD